MCRTTIVLFCLLSLTACRVLAGISGNSDTISVFTPTIRVTFQTSVAIGDLGIEKPLSYRSVIVGVGAVPKSAWIPDPHLYLSYGRRSFEQFSGLSGVSLGYGKNNTVRISAALRFFGIFVVGYGYFNGRTHKKFHSTSWGTPDDREITYDETGKFWQIGLDTDIRVYRNAYVALGLNLIPPVVNAGISLRF